MKYSKFESSPFHFISNRLWVFGSDKWNADKGEYEPKWVDIRTEEVLELANTWNKKAGQ